MRKVLRFWLEDAKRMDRWYKYHHDPCDGEDFEPVNSEEDASLFLAALGGEVHRESGVVLFGFKELPQQFVTDICMMFPFIQQVK